MFNEYIITQLISNFGIESATKYAFMEAFKNKLLMKDFEKNFPDDPNEYEYEYEWWKNKYKELTINNEN